MRCGTSNGHCPWPVVISALLKDQEAEVGNASVYWRASSKFCDKPGPHVFHNEVSPLHLSRSAPTGAGQDFGDPLPDVDVANVHYRVQMFDSKNSVLNRRFDVCDKSSPRVSVVPFTMPPTLRRTKARASRLKRQSLQICKRMFRRSKTWAGFWNGPVQKWCKSADHRRALARTPQIKRRRVRLVDFLNRRTCLLTTAIVSTPFFLGCPLVKSEISIVFLRNYLHVFPRCRRSREVTNNLSLTCHTWPQSRLKFSNPTSSNWKECSKLLYSTSPCSIQTVFRLPGLALFPPAEPPSRTHRDRCDIWKHTLGTGSWGGKTALSIGLRGYPPGRSWGSSKKLKAWQGYGPQFGLMVTIEWHR